MTELEERLEQVRWKVMPAGPQRRENCGTLDVPAEECRVLRLVQGIASCLRHDGATIYGKRLRG